MPTDQNRCLSEEKDNTSHKTLNTVTRNGQSNNKDLENRLEASSAKRRIEEKMMDFENDFETKLQIKKTQSKRKKLDLETQMKELEMQHQLREKEPELEHKSQITILEKDDVRSQSTKARDKSPFNWISRKRDVSEWANTISETQTPTRPKTRFDVILNGVKIGIFTIS